MGVGLKHLGIFGPTRKINSRCDEDKDRYGYARVSLWRVVSGVVVRRSVEAGLAYCAQYFPQNNILTAPVRLPLLTHGCLAENYAMGSVQGRVPSSGRGGGGAARGGGEGRGGGTTPVNELLTDRWMAGGDVGQLLIGYCTKVLPVSDPIRSSL